MVTTRLSLKDAQEKGWLLDGYPRSFAQAESLEKKNIRPDLYIMLDVRVLLYIDVLKLLLCQPVVEACCIPILLLEREGKKEANNSLEITQTKEGFIYLGRRLEN